MNHHQIIFAAALILLSVSTVYAKKDGPAVTKKALQCHQCHGIVGYATSGKPLDNQDFACFQSAAAQPWPSPTNESQAAQSTFLSADRSSSIVTTQADDELTEYCVTVRGRLTMNFDKAEITSSTKELYSLEFIGRGKIVINETKVTGHPVSPTNAFPLSETCWSNQDTYVHTLGPLLDSWKEIWTTVTVAKETYKAYHLGSDEIETCYCRSTDGCNWSPNPLSFKKVYGPWIQ